MQMHWLRNIFVSPDEVYSVPGAQKQSTWMPIAVGMFAAVGGFIYGYDTGIINSLADMEYVLNEFAANHTYFVAKETSILTAVLSLGTFFGALFAPLLSDTVGRRYAIIISTFLIFSVGNVCQIVSAGIPLFCVGRAISGLSIGVISAVVPLYQAEASPKFVRGAIISTYQWAITWGLLASSAVCQGTHAKDSAFSYRLPIGLQFIWSLVLGVGMIFLPESPRFFVKKDDLQRALESLSRLRKVPISDPGLVEELVEIKASHDYEMSFGTSSFIDCFKTAKGRPRQIHRILTGIVLQALQQCSGVNFIFYYGVNFFSKSGISQSYIISLVTYAVNVIFTIPGIILVETIGRRKILIFGGTIMGVANLIIAIVGVTTHTVIANKVMIAFVCLFIASFAASWGPIVWVVCSESFPLGVRGKSVAITAATNWLVNFVFAYITPYLVDTGNHTAALGTKIFFIWGGLNIIGVIMVYFTVFETKGLSLEEIDELFKVCPNAITSSSFGGSLDISAHNLNEQLPVTDQYRNHIDEDNEKKYSVSHSTSTDPDSYNNRHSGGNSNEKIINASMNSNLEGVSVGQEPEAAYIDERVSPFSQYLVQDDHSYNEVDLGYGLSLATQNRGPPSIPSVSSDEEEGHNNEEESVTFNSLSEYVFHLTSNDHRISDQGGVSNPSMMAVNPLQAVVRDRSASPPTVPHVTTSDHDDLPESSDDDTGSSSELSIFE